METIYVDISVQNSFHRHSFDSVTQELDNRQMIQFKTSEYGDISLVIQSHVKDH